MRALPLATGILAALGILAGAAGTSMRLARGMTLSELVVLLFLATFLASACATQLYRRALPGATLLGAISGGWSVLSYFAAPFLILPLAGLGDIPTAREAATLLVVAPLVASALGAMGTLVLQQGVRRYRAKHGRVHAPR